MTGAIFVIGWVVFTILVPGLIVHRVSPAEPSQPRPARSIHPTVKAAQARATARIICQEDEWCWDAFIDGNHIGHYTLPTN